MTIRSLVLAAMVAAGLLNSGDQANAQWRRNRAAYSYQYAYPTYTYPSYTYSYSPGMVATYSTVPNYTTSTTGTVIPANGVITSPGVVTSTSYSYPYSGTYWDPYSGTYTSPYTGVYNMSQYYSPGSPNYWGYNNVYSNGLYGVGSSGVRIGPWRGRW